MWVLPVIAIDKSEQQEPEVHVEIVNTSAQEVVYHRQQWPTPIYFFHFDFVMEGKRLAPPSLEGEVFSKEGIRLLAPGDSLPCSIGMGAYEATENDTRSLPPGRYQLNAFYDKGEYWKEYEERYAMTPVHLNRPVALIDLVDRESRDASDSDRGALRSRWASRDAQEAHVRHVIDRPGFTDDPHGPLIVMPVIRFDQPQKSMEVELEIQNASSEAIRYVAGGNGNLPRDLQLILIREGADTPITDGPDPRGPHSVATVEAYQSIPVWISLDEYEFGDAEGVPLGRYAMYAKYSAKGGSATKGGITSLEFERAILLIEVVQEQGNAARTTHPRRSKRNGPRSRGGELV
jgi:hypothetical protein